MVSGRRWIPESGTKASADFAAKMRATYPVEIEEATVAGVKATIVTPKRAAPHKLDRVLICLHGGGFTSDSGSVFESISIAALTGTRVISVLYQTGAAVPVPCRGGRCRRGLQGCPQGPCAGEDRPLRDFRRRRSHGPDGGRARRLGLPLPAVLGFFSGYVDLARYGDSRFLYGTRGFTDFSSMLPALKGLGMVPYVADHDRKDPVLSPIYADLKGFPPTLCMTSTRDHCLSGTVDFHRALLRAGVDARLMVFDAMPHAFWYLFDLPESREALQAQASFLDRHLKLTDGTK